MKQLIVALIKFQKQVKTIPKNKRNPFYDSMYADLAQVIDVCQPSLNDNGLAITQSFVSNEFGNLLVTRLMHESGEILESQIVLPQISDAQKLTGAITYLRRTTFLSICGLCADDDLDGNDIVQVPHVKPSASKTDYPASDAQKNAMRKMGIQFNDNVTKSEASRLIEAKNKDKK
jgi:hypothetical protein